MSHSANIRGGNRKGLPSLVLCLRAAGAFSAGALPVAALPRSPPLTSSSRWLSLAAVSLPQCSLSPEHPGQQHLSTAPRPATSSRWRSATAPLPATSSRWRSATAPLPAVSLPLRRPRPATNLIRQRSTPVWLAIWRTWTGFANSQLRCANFPALIYIYASIPIAATLESLLRQTQIFRPICPDCLRHLRISAG